MAARVIVIGGGITGRLVQYAYPSARIFDWNPEPKVGQKFLTRQYGANYLWHPIPGLPYRSFTVITHVDGADPTTESIRRYKEKIGKTDDGGNWGLQFQPEMLGYELTDGVPATIEYSKRVTSIVPRKRALVLSTGEWVVYDQLISTIPMNALLQLIDDEELQYTTQFAIFRHSPIYVKVEVRPPDALFPRDVMYVNYISHPDLSPYRFCDRDGERHYEGLTSMGVLPTKRLVPGKIHPIDPFHHRDIEAALAARGIVGFGRYGAWQPDELVHETWQHIQLWLEMVR